MDKLIRRNVAGCHAAVGELRRSQHVRHLVQGLLDGEVVRQGKTHGARGGGQNHSRQSGVGGVRMAKWLRPGLWEVLTIKLRGIKPGQILAHKKSI